MAKEDTFRCEHHAETLHYRFLGSAENARAMRIHGGDDQDLRFALQCLHQQVNLPRIKHRWTVTAPRVFEMPGAKHPVPIDNMGPNRKHVVFERSGDPARGVLRKRVVLRFETRVPRGLLGAIRKVFEARFGGTQTEVRETHDPYRKD